MSCKHYAPYVDRINKARIKLTIWKSALKNNNTGIGLRGTKVICSLIEEFWLWLLTNDLDPADFTILDVGCGCCHLIQHLSMCFCYSDIVGIDIDPTLETR